MFKARIIGGLLIGLALILTSHPAFAATAAAGATVKTGSNLRAAPNTTSAILAGLPAGTRVEVLCWAYGEPTYGTDAYGSMWLYTTLGGWVHSFLLTPVDVGPCASSGSSLYNRLPATGWYANCDQAIAAGVAPLFVGEPGYALHLDRDKDGIACEWDE